MKLGVESIKKFFSNQDFKWFDTKEIRNEKSLSPEELKYIKGWTISPIGVGGVIYLVTRKLPDLLTAYAFVLIYSEIVDIIPGSWSHSTLTTFFSVLNLIIGLFGLYTLIFLLRHGRRLSWNRGRYAWGFSQRTIQFQSVDELKKSENNFIYFSVIPSLILILFLLMSIYFF